MHEFSQKLFHVYVIRGGFIHENDNSNIIIEKYSKYMAEIYYKLMMWLCLLIWEHVNETDWDNHFWCNRFDDLANSTASSTVFVKPAVSHFLE